jgi:CRISPR-associated protein Cas1
VNDQTEGRAEKLNDKGRRKVVTAWQERKQEEITHPLTESKMPLALLPFIQARFMARTLRSEMEAYLPYLHK